MKNKIIVSGCSYSAHSGTTPYSTLLKQKYGYSVYNMAWPGSSNESIINRIYECITKNSLKDSLIICQLTYTHRTGWYHSSIKRWVDYQPRYIQSIPEYNVESDSVKFEISTNETFMEGGETPIPKDLTKEQFKTLTDMYQTWLEYVYDETQMFNYLLYKVDTLKAFVESTGNKIKFIYWPDFKDKSQLEQIKKRDFLNIDGEYSMLKWSTKNKLVDTTSHLNKNGHEIFCYNINTCIEHNMSNFNELKSLL
jgi:hypothetical protein